MSQVVTRAVAAHDKEKRTDSPVRDTKKKDNKVEVKEKDAKDTKENAKETREQAPEKADKADKAEKPSQNGKPAPKATNGHNCQPVVIVTDLALNGDTNGAAASGDDDVVVIDDEQFPELAYDDDSDEDESPEPSRSVTRRSQVKPTRTPETPRPASDKTDKDKSDDDKQEKDQSKEAKSSKQKEEASTVRKLRSADKGNEKDSEEDNESRRETNFSKSRVKVSPYRRSANDTTTMANYTGNNTTMEMDITESSFVSQSDDQSMVSNRSEFSVRARKSYKRLKPVKFEKPPNAAVTVVNTSAGRRLCGAVVGRKRKPADDESFEATNDQDVQAPKRTRDSLFDRMVAIPFLRGRKNSQIVGINSDLPMACPISVDPEVITLEASAEAPIIQLPEPPIEVATEAKPTNRTCIVM